MPSNPFAGCTIAFDLDGTLVDSAPDIHRALNAILMQENLPAASLEAVRSFVGHGARHTLVKAAEAHGVAFEDRRLDELTEQFTNIYAADIALLTRPWPGVEAALGRFRDEGVLLCVCTNKRSFLSRRLLEALDMIHWFAAVVGADDVGQKKPQPDHFLAAVRAAKGDPARALMVGDSAADVGSARGAGAPVALVAFGYTDTAPELLGADAVFTHFDELPELARKLLGSGIPSRSGY
jgi:phosphoglycolate phosphatase